MGGVSGDARFTVATIGGFALLVMVAGCSEAEAPKGFTPERSVIAQPTVGQADAGATPACPLLCGNQAFEATFDLSCAPSDLASITLTGPCAYSDAGSTTYVEHDWLRPWIKIASGRPGVCSVALLFANGFAYSADVDFVLQAGGAPPGCPACPASVTPTQSTFAVNNPSTTCVDAGSEMDGDATVDGPPGCVGGCQ